MPVWDIGADGSKFHDPAFWKAALKAEFVENVIPLAGTSAGQLMDEAMVHAKDWEFVDYAPDLHTRPVLLITADDGLPPNNNRLAAALHKASGQVSEIHMQTNHPYSDHRIALESAVVNWLAARHGNRSKKPCCAGGFGPARPPANA
jgi:hypothetical protein